MRFHRSTERWFTNVNHSEQVESQGAQNTAGGEYSAHSTRLLTGGPPAVFDISDNSSNRSLDGVLNAVLDKPRDIEPNSNYLSKEDPEFYRMYHDSRVKEQVIEFVQAESEDEDDEFSNSPPFIFYTRDQYFE